MPRTLVVWVLACLLATASGCYTGLQAYVPRRATVDGERAVVVAAVREAAQARGLRVVRADVESGTVVAVSRVMDMDGLRARERWRFGVRGSEVRVELYPETRETIDGRRRWVRADFVCDCYRYARERELLRDVRARVSRVAPTASWSLARLSGHPGAN